MAELDKIMAGPGFWDDAQKAKEIGRERTELEQAVRGVTSLTGLLEDAETLLELAQEEGDKASAKEAQGLLAELERGVARQEAARLLGQPEDAASAIISINAGAGGTDAQDWTEMLLRQYSRFAERHGFGVVLLDLQEGEEAGIKSATLEVNGHQAYGLMKGEAGVHRLVRISPFDASHRRHTAFEIGRAHV
jgi:peptide chain release factor 2